MLNPTFSLLYFEIIYSVLIFIRNKLIFRPKLALIPLCDPATRKGLSTFETELNPVGPITGTG